MFRARLSLCGFTKVVVVVPVPLPPCESEGCCEVDDPDELGRVVLLWLPVAVGPREEERELERPCEASMKGRGNCCCV